jgi:predicted glutamine amidotransferase
MCGLVGIYSSNMFNKHKECLSYLLYLDTWRGRDSTGVAVIRGNGVTDTLKMTIPGYEFVEGNRLDAHLRLNDFCWIGHNRYGTIGKNTRLNAHPFEILDEDGGCLLVGAHNGTLKNKHVLDDHAQFGTDSEALFNHIAFNGLNKTMPLIEGAWALSYFDHVENELRFLRNKERTLFYAWEEGKKTLIWASEQWMIRVSASRAGMKLEGDQVWSFAEDTLYKFPAPEKMNAEITCDREGGLVGKTIGFFQGGWTSERGGGSLGPRTQQEAAAKARRQTQAARASAAAIVASQGPSWAAGGTNTQSGTKRKDSGEKLTQTNESSSSQASSGEQPGPSEVVDINSAKKYKGYAGVLFTKKEMEDQLENGCAWCETEFICLDDKHGWIDPHNPICQKCLDGVHEEPPKVKGVAVH